MVFKAEHSPFFQSHPPSAHPAHISIPEPSVPVLLCLSLCWQCLPTPPYPTNPYSSSIKAQSNQLYARAAHTPYIHVHPRLPSPFPVSGIGLSLFLWVLTIVVRGSHSEEMTR